MTIKQCTICKKKNGLLVEMTTKDVASYHGKRYHASCLLSAQGTIHERGDEKDLCEVGQCNALLFEPLPSRSGSRWKLVAYAAAFFVKMYHAVLLWMLAGSHVLSYLGLAFVLYCIMMARLFWSAANFGILCGALFVLLVYSTRSNARRLGAILLGAGYLLYYGDVERIAAFYYDVLIIPKIMLVLFLCERGLRVCMLWRIVDRSMEGKEYGSLLWTLQSWPFLYHFPLYVSTAAGVLANVFCYAARLPLLAPLYTLALVGLVSWLLLLYPLTRRPRWKVHVEELVSLPF